MRGTHRVAPSSINPWFHSPAASAGTQRLGEAPRARHPLRRAHVVVEREEPCQHARHVPVDQRRGAIEGDAGDGPRGVRTDGRATARSPSTVPGS